MFPGIAAWTVRPFARECSVIARIRRIVSAMPFGVWLGWDKGCRFPLTPRGRRLIPGSRFSSGLRSRARIHLSPLKGFATGGKASRRLLMAGFGFTNRAPLWQKGPSCFLRSILLGKSELSWLLFVVDDPDQMEGSAEAALVGED